LREANLETERIVQGLIERTLSKSEWTHQAHLRAGLWHVLHHSDEVALQLLRQRISAYNNATGLANTASSDETITRFYVIRTFVRFADASRPIDELAEELIARFGDRKLPLRYYTQSRLFCATARLSWMEPDMKPLQGDPVLASGGSKPREC
jgi:hypothetical protein